MVLDVRDRQQGYFPLGEWEKCLIVCRVGKVMGLSDGQVTYANIRLCLSSSESIPNQTT